MFLRPYWKSRARATVLGRNPGATIHQQAQKKCSLLLSGVQLLDSGFSDFLGSAQPPAPCIALALASPTSCALNLLSTLNFPVLSL